MSGLRCFPPSKYLLADVVPRYKESWAELQNQFSEECLLTVLGMHADNCSAGGAQSIHPYITVPGRG